MADDIKLSYILTTYNKLNYLKITLPYLIEACGADEEIVITDGGSNDGTVEYLTGLYQSGKIHQFVSERDFGEAHGTNKAILMARGEIIKLITDDDVFSYSAIKECCEFMLANRNVDILAANIGIMDLDKPSSICFAVEFENAYRNWMETGETAFFCGLSLMFRKSSLARTGLFYSGFVQIDLEFSARITKLNVNLAWYLPPMVVAVRNPKSNFTNLNEQRGITEQKKVSEFYDWKYYNRINSLGSKLKDVVRPLKNILVGKSSYAGNENLELPEDVMRSFSSEEAIKIPYLAANYWLQHFEKRNENPFLLKNKESVTKIQE